MSIEVVGVDPEWVIPSVEFFCACLEIAVPNLLIYIDNVMEANGECYENYHGEYMILLKERSQFEMKQTLAHELTHVKQFLRDGLGVHIDTSIPYEERWWEREAFEKEQILIELFSENDK